MSEKIVKGRFIVPNTNVGVFYKIRIAKSSIPEAGLGAYAVDFIPEGMRGVYRGALKKRSKNIDPYYSWEINEFDSDTGDEIEDGEILYYIDCSDPKTGNWARYVNCGSQSTDNNFDSKQCFGKMYYVASRDIEPGEELFIDYGEGYRTEHLGIDDEEY